MNEKLDKEYEIMTDQFITEITEHGMERSLIKKYLIDAGKTMLWEYLKEKQDVKRMIELLDDHNEHHK